MLWPLVCTALVAFVSSHQILQGKIPLDNRRFHTYNQVLDLLDKSNALNLVETSTARYGSKRCVDEGCSTIIFGEWAKLNDAFLYSLHTDERLIQNARNSIDSDALTIAFIHQRSTDYLRTFPSYIDLLVLDSEDVFSDHVACQYHHYQEILAAYDKLHRDSIVLLDDCQAEYGGRCRLAMEYLLARGGWKVTRDDYALVLRYFGTELPKVIHTPDKRVIIKYRQTLLWSHSIVLTPPMCHEPYRFERGTHGDLPAHAVKVSMDRGDPFSPSSCYIGRTTFRNATVHGCIHPQLGYLSFPYGTREYHTDKYEALVIEGDVRLEWVGGHSGQVPKHAVYSDGQYIGRVMHYGMWTVGKIEPACHCIYIARDGREVVYGEYQVLTIPPPTSSL